MDDLERIKGAADCVVTHVYEQGRLTALRYRSALLGAEAEERVELKEHPSGKPEGIDMGFSPRKKQREE